MPRITDLLLCLSVKTHYGTAGQAQKLNNSREFKTASFSLKECSLSENIIQKRCRFVVNEFCERHST